MAAAAVHLPYRKSHPDARIDAPRAGDVGYDVYSVERIFCGGGGSPLRQVMRVRTGLHFACPEGYYLRIAPRSGLALQHVGVGGGVIDPSYRGELIVILYVDQGFEKPAGTKIAQLILEKCATPPLTEVAVLPETGRGAGGFGSTDISASSTGSTQ